MYVRVYAPDGEPFDVSRERADHLILNCGWTQTPTVSEEVAVIEKPKHRRRNPADAGPTKTQE